jgi:Tfp pilus assembly protein PilF
MAADAIADYERSRDEFDVIRRLTEALALGLKEVSPDRVYTFLGAAYGDVGLNAEAEQAYEAALAHNARNSTALSNLGMLLERRGELARARELYAQAIEVKPGNGYAHNNLGLLLLRQGLHREARRALERATEVDPTLAVAFANLARCCAAMGDFAAAQLAFQYASQRRYDQLDSLQRELTDQKLSLPPVYFDEEAFFRLADQLLPSRPEFRSMLERAVREPHTLYAELAAGGRTLFLTEYLVSKALPWLLMCEELQLQGLAVRGAGRSLESWIELVGVAAQKRGISWLWQDTQALAAELRSYARERGGHDDNEALDAFFHLLTQDGTVVLLRMWEGQTQALLCPLTRQGWDAAAYPLFDGPEGPGMVQLLGTALPEPCLDASKLN